MTDELERFRWPDHLILAFTLAISCGVGIYYGIRERKKNTTEDFLMAGRSMHPIPVSLSLFVSWMSAITFLADPVEIYYYGGIYVMYAVGYTIAFPIIAHVFAPVYFRLRLTSLFEFLELHYKSTSLRTVASIGLGIGMMCYLSVVLFAPAVALSLVTGLPIWGTILMIGLVCMLYTTLGGMKAVIWADALQFGFMLLGLIAVCAAGLYNLGGFTRVWDIASQGNRTDFSKWSPDPLQRSSFWILVVGGMFRILNPYIAGQIWVQRYCTLRSERDVKICVYLNVPIYIIFVLLFTLAGFILYASYHDCDPMLAGRIKKNDQMVPLMIMDQLGFIPGISGLFVGSLLSASLSTMSSGQSGLATMFLNDVIQPLYRRKRRRQLEHLEGVGLKGEGEERFEMSERMSTYLAKLLSGVFGLINMSVSLALLLLSNPTLFHLSLAFINAFIGPISGIFYVAVLFPFVTTWSVLGGAVVGTILSCIITMGSLIFDIKHTKLPTSVESCPAPNSTFFYLDVNDYYTNRTIDENIFNSTMIQDSVPVSGWMNIYRISPILFPVVGPLICVVVALTLYLCSRIRILIVRRCCEGRGQDKKPRRQRKRSTDDEKIKRQQIMLQNNNQPNQYNPEAQVKPGASSVDQSLVGLKRTGAVRGGLLESNL